jgi:hypothetical protein
VAQRLSLVTLGVPDPAVTATFHKVLGWRRGMRRADGSVRLPD